MPLPVSQVMFTPLRLDGSGGPQVAFGTYMVAPTAAFIDTPDLGRVEMFPFLFNINGIATTVDMAVTPTDFSWVHKVVGSFPDATAENGVRITVEYVAVPASGPVLRFENLTRIDPGTLGPAVVLSTAEGIRLAAVELAVTQVSGGASTLASITNMSPFMRTVNVAVDAAAARTAIGAGTGGSGGLVIGTTAGTAADGAVVAAMGTTAAANTANITANSAAITTNANGLATNAAAIAANTVTDTANTNAINANTTAIAAKVTYPGGGTDGAVLTKAGTGASWSTTSIAGYVASTDVTSIVYSPTPPTGAATNGVLVLIPVQ